MSVFFVDSSALVKRYMPETGTVWIRSLAASSAGHDLAIAQITPVEMMSAIGRQYHDGHIQLAVFQAFRRLVLYHMQHQYHVIALSSSIVMRALQLHEQHRMRGYDAVQLATALELQGRLAVSGQQVTFLSADVRLLAAASAEGLLIDNPTLHS